MVLLNGVINKGFDGGLLIQGLAKHVRNVLMAKDPQTLPLLEVSDQQRQRYQEQAKKIDTRFLYQALRLMNQCDINYRQSSNKRLLVELTLIEIAQITQADDSASAGRSPRRLKSLFKHLIRQSTQPQTAAPQVAAAKPVASPHPASAPQEKSTAVGNSPLQAPSPKPGIKLGGLGFSWSNLRNNDKKSGKMNIIPGTPADNSNRPRTDMPFTQEDLELQWLSMCNRMQEKNPSLVGIASRMKNMNPVITEFPKVEVVVDNDLIRQDMEKILKSITKTLQIYLRNVNISLTILVSDKPEKERILTRREQFEEMSKENPAVETLRQVFNLELA